MLRVTLIAGLLVQRLNTMECVRHWRLDVGFGRWQLRVRLRLPLDLYESLLRRPEHISVLRVDSESPILEHKDAGLHWFQLAQSFFTFELFLHLLLTFLIEADEISIKLLLGALKVVLENEMIEAF